MTAPIRINASECLKCKIAAGLPESETGAALLTADDRVSRSCLEKAATAGATTATASAVSKMHSSGSLHFEDDAEAAEAAADPSSIITEAGLVLEARVLVLLSITTVECGDSESESAARMGDRANSSSSIQSSRPTLLFRPIITLLNQSVVACSGRRRRRQDECGFVAPPLLHFIVRALHLFVFVVVIAVPFRCTNFSVAILKKRSSLHPASPPPPLTCSELRTFAGDE